MRKKKAIMILSSVILLAAVVIVLSQGPLSFFAKTTDTNKLPGNQYNPNRKEGFNEGNIAPDFSLLDTEGNKYSLEQYKGKTVVLNFWAST